MSTQALVELLDVRDRDGEPCLQVRWLHGADTVSFRWKVDAATFASVKRVWEASVQASRRCRFSHRVLRIGDQHYARLHYVRQSTSNSQLIACDAQFAANLKWLAAVRDPVEIRRLTRSGGRGTRGRPLISASQPLRRSRSLRLAALCAALVMVVGVTAAATLLPPEHGMGELGAVQAAIAGEALNSLASSDPADAAESAGNQAVLDPCAGASGDLLAQVGSDEIALTFDDGPTPFTKGIVDVLDEHGARATFFFIGLHMEVWPESAAYAAAAGHAIGNHSYNHRDFRYMSQASQAGEIDHTSDQIEALAGYRPRLFRAPFGWTNAHTGELLADRDMVNVLWNRDPRDWQLRAPDEIAASVLSDNPAGGTVILHETAQTLAALPAILAGLQEQGITVVPLCRA